MFPKVADVSFWQGTLDRLIADAVGEVAKREQGWLQVPMTVLYDQMTVLYDQMTGLLTALEHSRTFDFE